MSKNLKQFFLYYKIKYFKSSAVDTTLTQKFHNKIDKLLKVGKKKSDILAKRER